MHAALLIDRIEFILNICTGCMSCMRCMAVKYLPMVHTIITIYYSSTIPSIIFKISYANGTPWSINVYVFVVCLLGFCCIYGHCALSLATSSFATPHSLLMLFNVLLMHSTEILNKSWIKFYWYTEIALPVKPSNGRKYLLVWAF